VTNAAPSPTDDYFLEIEGHFAMRRNTPFILSAKDWALMQRWREEGIPLAVVLEAIDSVFEKNESSGRKKVISSLSYCRHAIKELWQDRKDLHVGEGSVAPEARPAELLAALAGQLEQANAPAATVSELRALKSEQSVPRIEERLMEIERDMIHRVLDGLPAEEASEVRAQIARAVGDTSKLDAKTRARTEEANLRRIVREKFGLPRLTLFR
jgi:hypothetical protein